MLETPAHIAAIRPYVPGKPIEETQREFRIRKVIKLASNENPLGPSPKALMAMRLGLRSAHRYPDASGFRLKAALARFHTRKGVAYEPHHFILGNGSNEILDTVLRTFCKSDERVVSPKFSFIAYKVCAAVLGLGFVETPLKCHEGYDVDLEALYEAVRADERIKVVLLANPNNPTGAHIPKSELTAFLISLARLPREVLVVLDCAYVEYATAKDLPDPAAEGWIHEFSNLLVLRTFSKVYGLAGLRVGYALGNRKLLEPLEKVRQPFNVNSLGLAAAEAALADGAFVKRAVALNRRGLKQWMDGFAKLGLKAYPTQGNFILVDIRKSTGGAVSAETVYQECLRRGIILRPVSNYGLPDVLRVSVGSVAENSAALRVFSDVVKKLGGRNAR